MAESSRNGIWAQGEAYDRYVGRWSRLVADEFLNWIAVEPGLAWLDVGCGTGALCECILERRAPARIVGIDSSEGFVAHAQARMTDPRTRFRVGDARGLPVGADEFDATVSGLVLNFIPDPDKAVGEMRRVTRPGGKIAVYVWDYAGGMQMMRRFWDAAVALHPAARERDEGLRFPVCAPSPLATMFAAAGLRDIAVEAIDIPTTFADFNDYWTPFLGGQGPAPAYCMSLSEPERAALRDRIKASLPVSRDGKIRLTARAWAVQGLV